MNPEPSTLNPKSELQHPKPGGKEGAVGNVRREGKRHQHPGQHPPGVRLLPAWRQGWKPSYHPAGYQGSLGLFCDTLPLPYPQEPPLPLRHCLP